MMRRMIGGCGCLCIFVVALIAAFVLGGRYAPRLEKKVSDASQAVVEQTKSGIRKVDEKIKKTRESAELFCRDGNEPPPADKKP